MKHTDIYTETNNIAFAKEAAAYLAANKDKTTYTAGDIEPGCLFAMRWGLHDQSLLIFKLDRSFDPINYMDLIKEESE